MNTYQYLDNLICGYFNQDSDLDGDTMNEIINVYKSTHSTEQTDQLINNIQSFMTEASDTTSKQVAVNNSPDDIRCNAICPGFIETALIADGGITLT